MPKFAANLPMMFNEVPFIERFAAAANAGFTGVEYLFPYEFPASKNVTMAAWSRSPLPRVHERNEHLLCCAVKREANRASKSDLRRSPRVERSRPRTQAKVADVEPSVPAQLPFGMV